MSKRRCAGCKRVITGRPNKLYCSEACRQNGHRNRDKNVTVSGPVPSVIRGSKGQ